MEGVSKEDLARLIELATKLGDHDKAEMWMTLYTCCKELAPPWLKIQEDTPKDRLLLLYSPGTDGASRKFVGKLQSCWYWKPTHYQEITKDPE